MEPLLNLDSAAAVPENYKFLILKNLRQLRDKTSTLYESVIANNLQEVIIGSLLESIPQMMMHLSMALRVITDQVKDYDFASIMDQISFLQKETISSLDIEPELKELSQAIELCNSKFNFRGDQILTVESIVSAAFQNPERARFEYLTVSNSKAKFSTRFPNDKELIAFIKEKMPHLIINFDQKKILISKTQNHLYDGADKNEWASIIQDSRWYGPFSTAGKCDSSFYFQSINSKGDLKGLMFQIDTKSMEIYLHFMSNGASCGTPITSIEDEDSDGLSFDPIFLR